jgi:predicted Zn-ribbon and HTH transcriptional regulator
MSDLFINLRQELLTQSSLNNGISEQCINDHALNFLNKALNQGQLVSSYIFSGENCSSEKYLIAKELNKILNCERNSALIDNITKQSYINENKSNKLSTACNSCQNCKWIIEDKHPKTPLLINLEKGKNIKIEYIKKLQDTLSQSSSFFRIIIIDPADYEYLNKNSANALLKSIEEPHPRTLYLLFASSSKNVLGTLKSRSQCLQIFPEVSLNLQTCKQPLDAGLHEISSDSKEGRVAERTSSRLRRTNDRSVLRVHEDHEDDENAEIGVPLHAHEIKDTNEKNLHSIFKKYYDDNSLNTKTKNLLFSEEVKKFKREDVLKFCEELEAELYKELEERVLLNTGKQANQENASLKNLKDDISLIEKLETAKQELNGYINTQAVIQKIGLF